MLSRLYTLIIHIIQQLGHTLLPGLYSCAIVLWDWNIPRRCYLLPLLYLSVELITPLPVHMTNIEPLLFGYKKHIAVGIHPFYMPTPQH
jgi:hypothetical protein